MFQTQHVAFSLLPSKNQDKEIVHFLQRQWQGLFCKTTLQERSLGSYRHRYRICGCRNLSTVRKPHCIYTEIADQLWYLHTASLLWTSYVKLRSHFHASLKHEYLHQKMRHRGRKYQLSSHRMGIL